jgi:hypothetical protein
VPDSVRALWVLEFSTLHSSEHGTETGEFQLMARERELSPEDVAQIVKDDHAFKTWTIVSMVSQQKDIGFIKRYLSPSLWCNVVMAAGALVTVLYLVIRGH